MKKAALISVLIGALLFAVLLVRDLTRLDAHLKGARDPERTFRSRRPPLPNFRHPVDYVAWLNQYILEGKGERNAATYNGFWVHGDTDPSMPDPNETVVEKLVELSRGPTWEAGSHPEIETYMESVAPYIALFCREASKREFYLQLKRDPHAPWTASLPQSISGQYALYILLAQAWYEGENQVERIRDAWRVGLNHSAHLASSGAMLLQNRASSLRLILYQSVRDALRHGVVKGSESKGVLDMLTASEQPASGLTSALYSEWGISLSLLQALYAGGNLNRTLAEEIVGFDSVSGTAQLTDELRVSRLRPDRLVPLIDEYFVTVLRLVEHPLTGVSLQELRRLEGVATAALPLDHPLRWLVRPRLDRVYISALRALTSLRATATLLLLHQYYAKQNEWPESLEQLDVPDGSDYLIDPFSEDRFIYTRTADSFTLYSVGEDGIDNAGNHKEWRQMYETETGTDFVFWPVR